MRGIANGWLVLALVLGVVGSSHAQPQLPTMSAPGAAAAPSQGAPAAPAADVSASDYWAQIRDSNNPALYEEFLRRYPDHPFAGLAKAKLASLRAGSTSAAGQTSATAQPPQSAAPGAPQSIFGAPAAPAAAANPRELATALQEALKGIRCYSLAVDGDWGRGSQSALARFNALAKSDYDTDVPTAAALKAVKNWKGGNCVVVTKRAAPKTASKRAPAPAAAPPSSGSRGRIGITIGGGGVGVGF
jgi:hypothetical protein